MGGVEEKGGINGRARYVGDRTLHGITAKEEKSLIINVNGG